MSAALHVFSGLPSSGKSTLARLLARHLKAAYLRVDTVEAALLNLGGAVTVEGYAALYALAADNLELGLGVVADCVNPLAVTRGAWADVARRSGSVLTDIEVVCSDPNEHRRRVEGRRAGAASQGGRWSPPDWERAQRSEYEPWTTPRLLLDTARGTPGEQFARLLALLAPPSG